MKMDNSNLPNTNDDDFDVDAYIEKYIIAGSLVLHVLPSDSVTNVL